VLSQLPMNILKSLDRISSDNIALVEAAKLEKEKAEEKKVLEAVPEPECETCALPE
jgi:hypothetical protein